MTPPIPQLRSERGIALVLTLFAIVVIGALASGVFFVGRVEQVTGYNGMWSGQAAEAAEAGLAHANTNIDATTYLSIAVWSPAVPVELALPTRQITGLPGMAFTDTVRRLNQTLFLVRSTGQRQGGGRALATASLGALVRLAKPTVGVNAAVTVQDPIKFNGNSFSVDGFNSVPPQWSAGECPALDAGNSDDVVGIRSSTTTGAVGKDLDNISGFPTQVVDYDPTITSATSTHAMRLGSVP